jgi:hypothetical protein
MTEFTYEKIKNKWLGSPYGQYRSTTSIDLDAANALEMRDSDYYSEGEFTQIDPPRIKEGNIVEFGYSTYAGADASSGKIDKHDPEFVNYLYDTYSQYTPWMGVIDDTASAKITGLPDRYYRTPYPLLISERVTPDTAFDLNAMEIEADEALSLDEDLTEQTVLFTRTEDTLHIEVVDGLGLVDASYTISKSDYESTKVVEDNDSVVGIIDTFDRSHEEVADILYAQLTAGENDKGDVLIKEWEYYPLKPPVSNDLGVLPGIAESSGLPENLSENIPFLPTNDADVDRFVQEMKDRNLLFGMGRVSGMPEIPPPGEISEIDGEDYFNEEYPDESPVAPRPEGSRVQTAAAAARDLPASAPTKIKPGSKPAIMTQGIASDVAPNVGVGMNTGLLGRPLPEPVPFFDKCSSDKVLSGKNNTWIIFGRDRPGGLGSGYGPGQGHTQAGAIDIVVGRMSPKPISFDRDGNKVSVGPVFQSEKYDYGKAEVLDVMDAARIYISQKTDIDENFGLKQPKGDVLSFPTSGIGIKADAVRIMSRNGGVRIVTEPAGTTNSQGGFSTKESAGIHLIAANKANELQPMVLGQNLTLCLKDLIQLVADTVGMVTSIKSDLISLNSALLAHEHVNPLTGPTVKLPSLMAENIRGLVKLISVDTFSTYAGTSRVKTIEDTYLTDTNTSIKSKYNKVN